MTPTHHRDATRDIVLGVSITLALFAGAWVIPIFTPIGILGLPLATLVYRLKLGRIRGAAVPAIAFTIMAAVLGGGSASLFNLMGLLLIGFALGESFEHRFSVEKTVSVACGAIILAGLLVMFFYSRMTGVGIQDIASAYVTNYLSFYEAALNNMGASEETKAAVSAAIELIGPTMVWILPGAAVSGILFTVWITLLLARPVLQRVGLPYPDFGRLVQWQAPEKLVWVAIGCGVMLFMPASGLKLIGINGLMILVQVYFFQGVAIAAFFFEKNRMPHTIRWALYILLMILQPFIILVVGLGFFDMWLNLRKIEDKP